MDKENHIHQDSERVSKPKSCVKKLIFLPDSSTQVAPLDPHPTFWMSGPMPSPVSFPLITHWAHSEKSLGSPVFNIWDTWAFQLSGLTSYIKTAIFPFKISLFAASPLSAALYLFIFKSYNPSKESWALCSKEIWIFFLMHVKSQMPGFCAMLCSVGIRKQRGEGQWLPGVLIRCRSADEHQTIKSRVCCNCTPFVRLGMGRDGFGAVLKDHTGWLQNPITCWLSIDCLSINKPANMKWPLRPVVWGRGKTIY